MSDRRRPLGLRERLEVDHAIDIAFAPLRAERTSVSALRVRAAVRWGRGAPPRALPWSGTVRRLSELSVAVGMSVVIFAAALAPAGPVRETDEVQLAGPVEGDIVGDRPISADEQLVHELRFERAASVAVVLQALVREPDRLDPGSTRPTFPARLEPPAPRSISTTRGPY